MLTCYFENQNRASLRHVTVNAIVVKNQQVLLGLRGTLDGKPILESGKWALLGGFFDRDENLTQAVKREVMEESGWDIDHLQLFRINDNPNRPKEDRQNVDFIFIAQAIKQVGHHDAEVSRLKWFDFQHLPSAELFAFDHGEDVTLYLKYLKQPFPIPLLG